MNWWRRAVLTLAVRRFLKGRMMGTILAWLKGKKTYVTGVGAILMAIASLVGASIPGVPIIDKSTAIQTIVTSLLAIFIRNGVSSGK